MLSMSRSAVDVATAAFKTAQTSIPEFSCKYSPRTFSQWQLFAMLVVRQMLGMDYRSFVANLESWSDLREALGLKQVPHYSTLCVAENRLLKKGGLPVFSSPASSEQRLLA